MKYKRIPPNLHCCEGCPEWDDINCCWDDIKDICECPLMGEDLQYHDPDEDEYDTQEDEDWVIF